MLRHTKNYADYIFNTQAQKIFVYLPAGKAKNASYDVYRDVGYTKNHQNYLTVKGIVRPIKENELIIKTLGLVMFGAVKVNIKNKDVALFKLAEKITIDAIEYYVYNDAVGNKMQIIEADFGYSIITLFRKET